MDQIENRKLLIAEIWFWAGQAFTSLIAAYIASQSMRHGTLVAMPTSSDAIPILATFAIIFLVVASVTLIARRMNAQPD